MQLNKHFTALELNKILDRLAERACLEDSRYAALNICPSTDANAVELLLSETDDASKMISSFGAPSFSGAKNTASMLSRADAGAVLSLAELLDIAETLRTIRSVKEFYGNSPVQSNLLKRHFDRLFPNKYFEEKLFFSIKNEEELNDTASRELAEIRRKIRAAGQDIREKLDKLVHSQSSKYLQETIITQRDGRYVVPVKSEHRAEIKGLVHDTSASGATLFIEPLSVVEINNEIKILESKEKEEIERILSELSAEAASFAGVINASYEALVQLDLIFAKAELGFSMKAGKPILNTNGVIRLKNARQPLLNPKTAVPITVSLGDDYSVLVVTGSNTGGKTVALKTVGLLTAMAMCGLLIPADDGSTVCVFKNVLADIGDEQSIEEAFSTFSAHIANIISIIDKADENSLVLIDELGSGTDPKEGAALATAILKALMKKGAKVMTTSHYAELKTFAFETDGVTNACVEFDTVTLKPTYRFIVGMPGRSNAFTISEKLGLDPKIVDDARALIDSNDLRFDNIISKLQDLEHKTEIDREAAEKLRIRFEERENRAKNLENELKAKEDKIIGAAREKAQSIVDDVRREANGIINELDKIKKDAAKDAALKLYEAKASANRGLDRLYDISDPVEKVQTAEYKLPRPLKVGDNVEIMDIKKAATVLETADDKSMVLVLAGIIKTRVPENNLRLLDKAPREEKKYRTVRETKSETVRTAASEIDLRGMACDEAIMELDRFIDRAVLTGLTSVWIIHGKGTGVLRKAVGEHLRHHPSIKGHRLGVYGEGEDGVTVAELK